MDPSPPGLSVIVPVFNEESAIENSLNELLPVARKNNWEVIVVNDGSTDGTAKILDRVSGVQIKSHPRNKGYGASLKAGVRRARSEFVAFYDGDGQHAPAELLKLTQRMRDFDMVVGDRGKHFYVSPLRAPGKWILKKTAEILSGHRIPDLNSGLRIADKKKLLGILPLCPDGFSLSATSTVAFFKTGHSVGYVPMTVRKRIGRGTVKPVRHGMETILLLIRLIALFDPLKIFFPIGSFLVLIGVVYQIYILTAYGWHVEGGSLLAILSGLLILFFGILADQVSAMRRQMTPVSEKI